MYCLCFQCIFRIFLFFSLQLKYFFFEFSFISLHFVPSIHQSFHLSLKMLTALMKRARRGGHSSHKHVWQLCSEKHILLVIFLLYRDTMVLTEPGHLEHFVFFPWEWNFTSITFKGSKKTFSHENESWAHNHFVWLSKQIVSLILSKLLVTSILRFVHILVTYHFFPCSYTPHPTNNNSGITWQQCFWLTYTTFPENYICIGVMQ